MYQKKILIVSTVVTVGVLACVGILEASILKGHPVNNKIDIEVSAPTIEKHYLTIDPNGGLLSTGISSQQIIRPEMQYSTSSLNSLSNQTPSRAGYNFDGWYTEKTDGIMVYDADGACVTGTDYFDNDGHNIWTDDLTVYAHWKEAVIRETENQTVENPVTIITSLDAQKLNDSILMPHRHRIKGLICSSENAPEDSINIAPDGSNDILMANYDLSTQTAILYTNANKITIFSKDSSLAYYFNYFCTSLTNISGLSNWDVSQITNMEGMFLENYLITDISALQNWDVSNVRNMSIMFNSCSSKLDYSPLFNWNVGSNVNTEGMFSDVPLDELPLWYMP